MNKELQWYNNTWWKRLLIFGTMPIWGLPYVAILFTLYFICIILFSIIELVYYIAKGKKLGLLGLLN